MLSGPGKAASIADILRELSLARAERQLFTRPRPTTTPRFHEHLARTPAEDLIAFSSFLRQQNIEDRAAARRLDWCPTSSPGTANAPALGRNLDVYG